jgi:hypothetical protein
MIERDGAGWMEAVLGLAVSIPIDSKCIKRSVDSIIFQKLN